MTTLKVPSVQHLARMWRDTPNKIEDLLIKMAMNPPRFNYNALDYVARDILRFNTPEDQIIRGIEKKEKREKIQNTLVELVPLISSHFSNIQQDFVHDIAPRYYPIGRDLNVTVKFDFLYSVGGQIYLPWFIYWKKNPLTDEQLSLFVTLVKENLSQDPELENARFQILDFSASNSKAPRKLEVLDAEDIEIFDSRKTAEMLSIFVEGFESAQDKLIKEMPTKQKEVDIVIDSSQYPLL